VSVTTLIPTDLDRAALADQALRAAADLDPARRAELAAASMTGISLVLSFGVPTTEAGWARLEHALTIVACKDESLLDDALEYLG
jgi:hypothetical protein